MLQNLKQKPYDSEDHEDDQNKEGNPSKDGGDITQLDASPAPDAVSKVAMGGNAENDDEHTEIYNAEWIARLKGKPNDDICSIEDAYAMLFEGLAGIMKHKS